MAALALAASIAAPGAAVAEPSPAKARAKLVKLNEQADQLVEKFNQAGETFKSAKKKYTALNDELARKNVRADELRRDLVTAAVNDYQVGPLPLWGRLIGQSDPQALLSSMASLQEIAEARAAKIRAYEAATKELRDRRDEAKTALAAAETARDKVRDEKSKVDKLVKEQTKLLRELGAFKTGDPSSPGIQYTGPASGNARLALQFAFAQIGKPYRYGGTGPGSYDCSGLTQAAWRQGGVELPRTTYTQWGWGASRRVPLDQLQPGDLLFSKGPGHMGMYAGNGKMVHAPPRPETSSKSAPSTTTGVAACSARSARKVLTRT
ncbi:C40 family peptidase [Nonomuraea jabiensis]|uniref:Cell wall-associated NlpC family hydrolase n=1 Tax=Nonomuraea jabiensis TaxID=882448 RepID=A0A7W9GDY0_9ACTN|nr:NlpC/P60 family protein [Nonomuraea jabiensis]MBB5781821.1 cell wall-associated NlpC family hydrolase [Nonomuraea jabiensis]